MTAKQYVTIGGSHGIGLSLVRRLSAAGHQVAVYSRGNEQLAGLPGVTHATFDVTTDELAAGSLPDVIDGLVYCPGSINLGPIRGVRPDALVKEFELNVVGAIKSVQASLTAMKKSSQASVIMFSTIAVGQGLPMHAAVASVKGSIEGLVRSLAAELTPNVRVNAIAPSLTDTPLAEKLLSSDQKREAMGKRHPLGRVGQPDDIAAAAEFLLSDASSWMTGQVLGVDGGMSTLRP